MAFFRGSRGRQFFSYVPFLLLGFVFQLIARHLLYTPERYSGGKFRNSPPLLSHVCPAALSFDGYNKINHNWEKLGYGRTLAVRKQLSPSWCLCLPHMVDQKSDPTFDSRRRCFVFLCNIWLQPFCDQHHALWLLQRKLYAVGSIVISYGSLAPSEFPNGPIDACRRG